MKKELENNRWKSSEDKILKLGVMKYGTNLWNKISTLLINRSALECKERYMSHIDPSLNRSIWTEEEDTLLMELACTLKPQWVLIGEYMNRGSQECYERYLEMVYGKVDVYKHPEQCEDVQLAIEGEYMNMAYDRIKSCKNRKKDRVKRLQKRNKKPSKNHSD